MRLIVKLSGILMAVVLLVMVSGCASVGQPSSDAMTAANATAERVFQSFNTGNYTDFSLNLSTAMVQAVNESQFKDLRNSITGKYGKYESKTGPQLLTSTPGDNNYAYTTTFENGTLIFTISMSSANIYDLDGIHYRAA